MVELFQYGNQHRIHALVHCMNMELWLREINNPLAIATQL